MILQDKIEQNLEIIRELERNFCEAQGKEILPLSFFSSSINILNRLRTGIYEIEALQLQMMQEHVENNLDEIDEVHEVKGVNEVHEVLADTIGRKVGADFGKSLSLNDKFMFQRDLFKGNANGMNQAFAQLNVLQSLNEVLEFLNENYSIPWESDAGIVFKELLEKRFA